MNTSIPWQAKITAKLLLSRLPVNFEVWRKVGIFKHGNMHRAEYALSMFQSHLGYAGRIPSSMAGANCLELGPGDSLFSAVIARGMGAAKTVLVDVDSFAVSDVGAYRSFASFLQQKGFSPPSFDDSSSLEDILSRSGAEYHTQGVRSLSQIPDHSIDFIFSQAVLEHVRRRDFATLMKEMKRILKPDGVCSHRVDLKDHLAGALNNLRFPQRVWESDFFARSGFYTNRLRLSEIIQTAESAGFSIKLPVVERWSELPTPRRKLVEPFRSMPVEELSVSGFNMVLRSKEH